MPKTERTLKTPRSLLDMLTYSRPAGSRAEVEFIKRFLAPLGCEIDGAGNLIKRIGSAPVLWSCHTDTVHSGKGGRQNVRVEAGKIKLARDSQSSCLGADDSAGVWLMSEMIRAEVEGLYIFHRGEEIGGIGSTYIAEETPELLDGIRYAIALDRKGFDSVITYQGARCASDTFAGALADALGGDFEPDESGLFTDTANYAELIPECSNLSVGYEHAHSAKETLDVGFMLWLLPRLMRLDVSALPVARDPKADPEWGDDWGQWPKGDAARKWETVSGWGTPAGSGDDYYRLLRLAESEPEIIADILLHYGITPQEVERWKR